MAKGVADNEQAKGYGGPSPKNVEDDSDFNIVAGKDDKKYIDERGTQSHEEGRDKKM